MRAAALALALAAASPASAYVRSTTDSDPVTGPQPGSKPLFWSNRTIHYVVNASALDRTSPRLSGCTAATASQLVQASLPSWQQSCSDLRLVFDGDQPGDTEYGYAPGGPNTNLVVWRVGECDAQSDVLCHPQNPEDIGPCVAKYNCWAHGGGNTLALTTTTFNPDSGQIVDADMELHAWDGAAGSTDGFWFTCAPPGSPTCAPRGTGYGLLDCIQIDVGNTTTHEAGHVIGLDHTCVYPKPYDSCPPNSVMAPTAAPGETSKRTLSQDDKDAVCAIYPLSSGSSGCSSGGAGVLALLAVLVVLALRRRAARQRTIAPA